MNPSGPEPVPDGQVTRLLRGWREGDEAARQQLIEIAYAQLRVIAARTMQGQRPDHTLRPTELVHEAWLKLDGGQADFVDRAHFLGLAATAMRSILVDYARARASIKRFGGQERVPFDKASLTVTVDREAAPEELIDLDNALRQLARQDPRKGQLMELVYFGGLDAESAAAVLGIHVRTAQREIQFSRLWLKAAMKLRSTEEAVPSPSQIVS